MQMAKPTDLQSLTALLALPPGKLTRPEKSAFQAMYDSLAAGRQISLSRKQRDWVDGVYATHRLDKAPPPTKAIEVKDKRLLTVLPKEEEPKT